MSAAQNAASGERPLRWVLVAVAVAALVIGVALWPYAVDVLDTTFPPRRGYAVGKLLFLAGPWSFVAGGLLIWATRPERRLGRLLVVGGALLWFGGAVRFIDTPLAWTAGLALNFAPFPFIGYVLLAFPGDRLAAWWHRVIVALLGCWAVAAPIGMVFDGPLEGRNLLSVREIEGLYLVLDNISAVLMVLGLAAVAVTLMARCARATRPARRVLTPVAAPGLVFAASWATYLTYQTLSSWIGSGFNPPTTLYRILYTVFAASLVVLPAGFLTGLARGRARQARVGELARALATDDGLQSALRRTLGDDSVVLAIPLDGADRWVAVDGEPLDMPLEGDATRAVTYLDRRGRRVGAVVHDPALRHDSRLLDSVTGIAALAVENERLAAEVQARLSEVRASRARLVAAGDEARRRIERDLHDGAQQRLLSAALALRGAQVGLNGRLAEEVRAALAEVGREIDAGLSELRDLARGIHPTLLTDRGLAPALRALAARTPLPVEVDELPAARLSAQVEAAAYYVASEALTNAAKHAGATRARLSAQASVSELVISISDDGRGGATPARGGGLAGLIDRVEALDGSLEVASPAGGGTTVRATFPLAAPHA